MTKKIKSVQTRQVEITNLWKIQRLLLGKLTIEEICQLDWLTNALFKGNAYKASGKNNGNKQQRQTSRDLVNILVRGKPKNTIHSHRW